MIETNGDWRWIRAKYVYRVVDERCGAEELPLLAVSIHKGVVRRDTMTDDEARADDLSSYKRCAKHDIVVNRMRAFQGAIGIAPQAGIVSPDYLVLRIVEGEPRFFHHLFRSAWFVGEMTSRLRGIGGSEQGNVRTPRINSDELGEIRISLPSLPDQRGVADYLDAETMRIDALIEKKRRVAAVLAERRTSVTAECLSADSWPQVKLSLVARLGSGHTPSRGRSDWWEHCSIRWITTSDVAQMRDDRLEFIQQTTHKISKLGLANSAAELHPAGTVVLSRTASVGFSAIMGEPMATSQDFATWTCGTTLDPRFLLLCLRAMRSDLLGRLAMGSTHKTIYMPDIEGIRVPLPPRDEQSAIVTTIWQKLRPTDEAINRVERQIELLRERRQALITAAVTGQLDMAEAVA